MKLNFFREISLFYTLRIQGNDFKSVSIYKHCITEQVFSYSIYLTWAYFIFQDKSSTPEGGFTDFCVNKLPLRRQVYFTQKATSAEFHSTNSIYSVKKNVMEPRIDGSKLTNLCVPKYRE